MTVEQAIKTLESRGWRLNADDQRHHRFKHESEPRVITLSGRLDLAMPPGVLRSLWRHAQIQEDG